MPSIEIVVALQAIKQLLAINYGSDVLVGGAVLKHMVLLPCCSPSYVAIEMSCVDTRLAHTVRVISVNYLHR